MRRRLSGVAALVLGASLAACTHSGPTPKARATMGAMAPSGGAPGPPTRPSPTPTPPHTPGNRTPCPEVAKAELQQTVTGWSFDCGGIDVPQDWNHPANGKTFHIALIRVRSANQNNRVGSLVVNPGGPGGSGIGLAIDLTQSLPR